VVLFEFGTTSGDFGCLEDLPVHSIKMSPRVASRIANRADDNALFTRAIRSMVPLVRANGTPVIAGDVETEEQFAWWCEVGANAVQGTFVGGPGPLAALDLT
jgi:EAL domain-containing protein (putative c-di-GMP-specific phosphodiesterase class I)